MQFPYEDAGGTTSQIVGELTTRGQTSKGQHTRFPDSDEEKEPGEAGRLGKTL